MKYTIGPDLKLKELLKQFAQKAETGLLRIVPTEGNGGEIYLREGKPVHAVFGVLEGFDAIYALARLEAAEVLVEPFKKPGCETLSLEKNIDELLEQRRIHLEEIKKRLPSFDTVLLQSDELPRRDSLALRRTDWQVLTLFDGHRTLKEVIKVSPLPEESTLQAIDWLLEAGLLIYPEKDIIEK